MIKRVLALLGLSVQCLATPVGDIGYIGDYITIDNGKVGVTLKEGFPNAVQTHGCGNNNYMGINKTDNEHIVSTLLAAKMAEKKVKIISDGCLSGNWVGITQVHIIN